jgi:Response regulator containing CheY-like receiver domain and AraC-type DNA-binding domain
MYKVLIVDDEERIRKGLEMIIDWNAFGFTVCASAENGRAGIAKAKELSPNLIIADLRMPGINGIQMIRQLRSDGFQCHFIILSGVADFQYAQEAIELNVATYLLKPINEEELTKKIMQLFPLSETDPGLDTTALDIIKEILNYVNTNYHHPIKLNAIAETYHYSTPYLGRVFKKATGETFHGYLERVRMEKAKELLNKGHKVYVAAKMVGYSHVDYFADKFKAYTGVSPNEYKKYLSAGRQ